MNESTSFHLTGDIRPQISPTGFTVVEYEGVDVYWEG